MERTKTEAFVLARKGSSSRAFEKREIELPPLKENELLVKVEAFGLNFADVMARLGLYREAPAFPCVVGYEVVGIIQDVGSSVDKDLLGKRVVAFCRFGGYARLAITNDKAIALIDDMDSEQALALCTQGVTAYYMTNYLAPLKAGENVLVHAAAGGVGSILIQLAKLKGAKVYAKIGNINKSALVKALGADEVVCYSEAPYELQLKRILGESRLNVSYNPVGGSTFRTDMKLLGPCGRIFLFGGAQLTQGKWGILSALNFIRKMGRPLPIALMMQSKSVLGVNMLRIADHYPDVIRICLEEIIALAKSGQLKTCSGGKFPSSKLVEAHDFLESGKSTGKITVFWE
jgi:NADPH:quinone reductase-like Zn-dependent oxidoreductase